MTSLYVDRRGIRLTLESDVIVFYEDNTRIGTVPIQPLERIYLRGDIIVSSGVLGRLGRNGIGVIILSGRKGEATMFLPRAHNDASIRMAQFVKSADTVRRLQIAKWIVQAKITSQMEFIMELAESLPGRRKPLLDAAHSLEKMAGHVQSKPDIRVLRGVEGAAAATYFSAYEVVLPPEAEFSGRNRRPPKDPANALLSLSYTMLHAEAVLSCHGHGFDPNIGFLHEINFGRESLACDLVEPMRVVMDRFVWRAFASQTFRRRDFAKEKNGACLLGKAGRARFYQEIETPLISARKRLDEILSGMRSYVLDKGDEAELSDRI